MRAALRGRARLGYLLVPAVVRTERPAFGGWLLPSPFAFGRRTEWCGPAAIPVPRCLAVAGVVRHTGTRITVAPARHSGAYRNDRYQEYLKLGAGVMPTWRALRARVRLAVARLQPLSRNVRVDLGGGRRGVSQDLLNAAQVCPAFEQVGGGGVPDRVRSRVQ